MKPGLAALLANLPGIPGAADDVAALPVLPVVPLLNVLPPLPVPLFVTHVDEFTLDCTWSKQLLRLVVTAMTRTIQRMRLATPTNPRMCPREPCRSRSVVRRCP